jgi:hypothetical protein
MTTTERIEYSPPTRCVVPVSQFPRVDATKYAASLTQSDVTADEIDEAIAAFLETGNLYTVAMRCKKSLDTIERLFTNTEFKARLESAKKQLENLYVVFAERTLHEIASNRYMNEGARISAAKAIVERHDRKNDVAQLLERLDKIEQANQPGSASKQRFRKV